MSHSTQPPSILCPLPRRTHSNPIYNHNNHRNNNRTKKLEQELTSSDDVLSEFLSLFTPASEANRQSILIYQNHLDSSIQPTNGQSSNQSSQPTSPIRTTTSTPLSSSSSSSPPPPPPLLPPPPPSSSSSSSSFKPNQNHLPQPTEDLDLPPQIGLTVIPNHLSSIVSSPISRCHNPLPRHAELDVLASRLTKPFESFELHQDHHPHHHLSLDAKDGQRAAIDEDAQSDHPLATLMPALTLEPSVPALDDPPTKSVV
ncbi:uncharacterized protein PGTG_10705 [Puccinia graminis f. sp. tritici CRL 75-36-700-3]|uniref:Uncharacterized protein n=1 Tax=Puccinia graminis f. sp. tritici (strain CRL 75-36-700-3 / race SCCL) TaxID=418459 RepID=E3KJS1_PUCGT|nr:uncharacterized protein PGTG_10705 [Puccinia graminis f. sp. tritici CRL 75-36-700-3]EFP84546.1 hypothetical protein PGTG_10705 [Puccinia graminis f. sp. tritici CRL 75-36-700-3]